MEIDPEERREVVARVADMIAGAAGHLSRGGVDPEIVAQGAWAGALQVAQDTIGLPALIEWLRSTSDELEDRLAKRLADEARRPN